MLTRVSARSLRRSLAFALALAAAPEPAQAQMASSQLRIIAPAAPGGGWDQTARVMQQALQRGGLVASAPVENIPGAAGTIGLARFIGAEHGQSDVVMVSGLIMLSAIVTNGSAVTLREVTPIARLTGEYEALVVPAASPFGSLRDLIRAFQEHPESISWGGGSAGGSDQILAGLVADAVGVSPRRVNYIAFSGGGEAMSAVLGGQVSVGINGLAEFAPQIEARTVRVLAISSAERLPGLDAPTLREQGVDVEFENWRSVVAAPGIRPDERERLTRMIEAMVQTTEWRDALVKYRWIDRYLAGEEFDRFALAEDARVRTILAKLGLGPGTSTPRAIVHFYPSLVLAGLVVFGGATLIGALRARSPSTVPSTTRPWRSGALMTAAILLDLALMERAGFVVASAVLFWLTAQAFEHRHPVRDALFATAVSTGSYFLFVRVLHVTLPAGGFLF